MRLLLAVLLLAGAPLQAQSTAFGKILYAPDRWWSSALEHNPWMRTLDDTEEKSAALTGVVVEAGGYALSKVTPMSFRRGRQVVAAMYVLRAAYGLSSGETKRYRAHAKHVAVASAVALLRVQIVVRW